MEKLESHNKYIREIKVTEADIDILEHVNNTVYLRWVQDIAIEHWNLFATDGEREKIFWVVVRHEIDYKRSTFLEDEVLLKTWVGKASRRSFERHTEIIRKKDKKILAQALTLWSSISSETRRSIVPEETIYERFSTNYFLSAE